MKKTIFILSVIIITAGIIATGCKSWEKAEPTRAEKATLLKEKQIDDEWQAFKTESKMKIDENDKSIAELKLKIRKPGDSYDALYEKKIGELEQKNNNLKIKMDNYEKNKTNWQVFKTEFKNDMYNLGQAFKGIVVHDKK